MLIGQESPAVSEPRQVTQAQRPRPRSRREGVFLANEEACSQEGHGQALSTHIPQSRSLQASKAELSHVGRCGQNAKCLQAPPSPAHLGQLEPPPLPRRGKARGGGGVRPQSLALAAAVASGLTPGSHTRDWVPPHAPLAQQAATPSCLLSLRKVRARPPPSSRKGL